MENASAWKPSFELAPDCTRAEEGSLLRAEKEDEEIVFWLSDHNGKQALNVRVDGVPEGTKLVIELRDEEETSIGQALLYPRPDRTGSLETAVALEENSVSAILLKLS